MNVYLLVAARRDLEEGFRFYERQGSGVGEHFLHSIQADIEALQHHAGVHRRYFQHYYRKPSRQFPYAIYYRSEDDAILVDAILDARRDPEWIRQRMS